MCLQISWLRLITVYYEYGKFEKFGDLHSVTIIRQKIVKIYNLIISTSGIWLRKSAISRVFERWNSWQKICLKISWLRLITVDYEYGRYEKIRWSSKLDNIKITNWCRVTTLSGFVSYKSAITQLLYETFLEWRNCLFSFQENQRLPNLLRDVLTCWQVDMLTGWHVDMLTCWQTEGLTSTYDDKSTWWQADMMTGWHDHKLTWWQEFWMAWFWAPKFETRTHRLAHSQV